jgi:hypothetical protein
MALLPSLVPLSVCAVRLSALFDAFIYVELCPHFMYTLFMNIFFFAAFVLLRCVRNWFAMLIFMYSWGNINSVLNKM